MQSSKLQITLSNASKIYFPGEDIKGEVELYLNSPTRFSVIITSISGVATIHKNSKVDGSQKSERIRVYFEEVFQFSRSDDGKNCTNSMWDGGSYRYAFEYKLPKGIPSSFESSEGHVRYKVCAFVDASESQNKHLTDLRFFCVNSILNLNGVTKVLKPKTVFKNDQFTFFCIHCNMVSMVVNIMKRGFVPGEKIQINAVVHNRMSSVIPRVEAILVQKVTYNFKNPSTQVKNTVAEIIRGPVMTSESQIWQNEELLIPPIVTSQSWDLINIEYKLYFTAFQTSDDENLVVKIPITIGNVPLPNDAKSFNTGSGDTPLAIHGLPKPNNEPCHFGPYNVVDYCGAFEYSANFIPKYCTYSISDVHFMETHV